MERVIGAVIGAVIRNPFEPLLSREVRTFPAGIKVGDVLSEFYPSMPHGYDVAIAVDGVVVHDSLSRVLGPGQSIVLCATPQGGGDGKNILGIVAMLAVLVAAPYVGEAAAGLYGGLAGGQIATTSALAGFISGAATIGTVIAGGIIVHSIWGPTIPDSPSASTFDQSPTYAWTPGGNVVTEGISLPEIFGTHRVTPPLIGKYIEVLGDKQYLNLLFAVANGPVDSISAIEINDTPIQYFEGVDKETRLGNIWQPVIQFFKDTRTDTYVGTKLTWPDLWDNETEYYDGDLVEYPASSGSFWESLQDSNTGHTPAEGSWWTANENWTQRTTSGNAVEGLGVTISLPKGLFYANNSGGTDQQTVKVQFEFKKVGDSEWTRYKLYSTSEATITDKRWSAGYYVYLNNRWIEIYPLAWDSGTTYETDDIVIHDDTTWVSLQDSNLNKDPTSEPTWWEEETDSSHTTGDVYEQAILEWTDADDPDLYNVVRPTVYWRQIEYETVVQPYEEAYDYAIITEAQTAPIHRTFYRDNLPEGQYEMRCRLAEEPEGANDPRYVNEVWFESIQEIIYDRFMYPGVALLAVRALATDQLSGSMPRVTCLVSRSTVPVYDGVSAYALKPMSNPAWASYHALHKARYKIYDLSLGDNTDPVNYEVEGVPASRIVYADFESWADWCDEQGFTMGLYVDSPFSVRRILDMIGASGRGAATQIGSKFTCLVDRPEELPVQRFLFGMGNIEADSFSEEFLPMDDRANAVEITFFDAALGYSRQTVTVYSSDFDTSGREINTAQITLYGCTSRDLAIRFAKYTLNKNRYLTLTGSWGADVDSLACRVNDVIECAHDIPQFGYSGRVVSSAASSSGVVTDDGTDGALTEIGEDGAYAEIGIGPTITLDREVTLSPSTDYIIRVRHQDDDTMETYECLQVATETTTDIVPIHTGYTKLPAQYANYSFGEVTTAVKEFRILRISRDQDLRRKITALEYIEEVYDDSQEVPDPEPDTDLAFIRRLTATEVWRGGAATNVYLKWIGVALFWNVYYRKTGASTWTFWEKAFTASSEITGLDYGVSYDFAVSHTSNPADGKTVQLTLVGKLTPPGDVDRISLTRESYGILIEWTPVLDFDVAGYELRYYIGEGTDWDTAPYYLVKTDATNYRWGIRTAGTYTILIKAFDAFRNESINATIGTLMINAPSVANVTPTFIGQNIVLTWDAVTGDFPVSEYEIRYGDSDETTYSETFIAETMFVDSTKAQGYSAKVDWEGTRVYWVIPIDIAGNYGSLASVDVVVISPKWSVQNPVSAEVIDNNVLLRWVKPPNPPSEYGSLPIQYFEIRRGDAFAESEVVGQQTGTFAALFESVGGDYIYWVVAVDTAGNYGNEAGVGATVNEPPDFILYTNWQDDFSGATLSNALLDNNRIILPVNLTETFSEHFTTRGWTTIQHAINDGYDYWLEIVPMTGYYEKTFNYGAEIEPQTKITLSIDGAKVDPDGAPVITPKISVSLNGQDWTDYTNGEWSIVESNFQYVKVRITVDGVVDAVQGNDFYRLDGLNVTVNLKQKSDQGRVQITDQGQIVYFNTSADFLDITSLTLTPESPDAGGTVIVALYDFYDAPNPTAFQVYIFDAETGLYVDNVWISWAAKGV